MVQILPYIEQRQRVQPAQLHRRASTTAANEHGPQAHDQHLPLPVRRRRRARPTASGLARSNNYAACHHDVEAPIDANNTGVFFLNSPTRYEDITDGTSHTIFVGEKLRTTGELGWASGTRATLRNTGTPINASSLAGLNPFAPTEDGDARQLPPAAGEPDPRLFVGGYCSRHAGGANFLFGDGSVRFIKNSTPPRPPPPRQPCRRGH